MDKSLRITFILPVINETYSLEQTVDTIFALAGGELHEVLIVTAESTTAESLDLIERIKQQRP